MAVSIVPVPSPAQWASAALHLEKRPLWRFYHLDGTRYAVLPSGTSDRLYTLRADATGCECRWYQQTGRQCSHMLALELAALEDDLTDAAIDAALGPPSPPRSRYEALFPGCRDCGDVADALDGYCDRCASDREWQARRDAATAYVAEQIDAGDGWKLNPLEDA